VRKQHRKANTRDAEPVLIPVSIGELIDKITILEIKSERIADTAKLLNIRYELDLLRAVWEEHRMVDPAIDALSNSLKKTNETLWRVEDELHPVSTGHRR